MDIPEHKMFYFKHGKRASSIEELKAALESISESEFNHHVTIDKNDFASWVEHVIGEKKLANDMRESGDQRGIIALLDDFIAKKNELLVPPPITHAEHKEHTKHRHKKTKIPEGQTLITEPDTELSEKELSERDIKNLVDDAMQVFGTSGHDKQETEYEKEEPDRIEIMEDKNADEGMGGEVAEDAGEDEAVYEHKPRLEIKKPSPVEEVGKGGPHKFMVEEFLYGFIMGLIFGLIMLGVILQLKIA